MKTMNYLKVVSTFLALLLIATSCSTSKKMALPCPKPVNNYKSKFGSSHNQNSIKLFASAPGNNKKRASFRNYSSQISKVHRKPVTTQSELNITKINTSLSESEKTPISNNFEYEANLYASVDNSIISVGEVFSPISRSIGEIPDFDIKESVYERVGTIQIDGNSSLEIISLTNSLETISSFRTTPINELPQETERKIEGLGLAGFIAGVVGLIVAGIPLGAIAIILSAVSLVKIKNNPGKYMGRGLAIAGLTLGIIDIVALLIILAAV